MKNLSEIRSLLKDFIASEEFPYKPYGKCISVVVLRTTQSEAIFRTDGELNKEMVSAGVKDSSPITRVIITKRKITASERRTGREFGRLKGFISESCSINKEMCGDCVDCLTYGFAGAEKGETSSGALKSRVITENSYSILEASKISDIKTFNATTEMGMMYDVEEEKESKRQRQSINSDEYVKPQSHFVDIETFKDLRFPEFLYAIGNIMRTTRYGATTTRIGKVKNKILAMVFSEGEIFSSLELVQNVWDMLESKEHPLDTQTVENTVLKATNQLVKSLPFSTRILTGEELKDVISGISEAYKSPEEELIPLISDLSSWRKN